MLPTFVIGLREGLEAALVVGIVAAFLRREGRGDALRYVWFGVGAAVTICVAVGVGLELANRALPQQKQEGLETVVGLVAVVAVTFMVLWMRRNAAALKGMLERDAARALAAGSTAALVGMAFFAVIREGFETVVFLIAAFDASTSPATAGGGALVGIAVAVAIGFGIYTGGIRINLARFFRVTGAVLVLVAAGLLATAVHTAHEAGWFNDLQTQALDLSSVVAPGTVRSALLTGMLGLQPKPTVGEALVYLAYAVPMLFVVFWPKGRRRRRLGRAAQSAGATALLALTVAVVAAGCGGSSETPAKAAGGGGSDVQQVTVTLTESGCPARLDLRAGPTTFAVRNDGAAAVSEFEVLDGDRIVGEVENVPPGLERSFSLTLRPGRYTTYCPGGDATERGTLVARGSAATTQAESSSAAVARYRAYLEAQTALLVERTDAFTAAVADGALEQAKRLYPHARAPYERIEPVAESLGGLDPAIDARAGDAPAKSWTGFHPIEQALWVRGSTRGLDTLAGKLRTDVRRLQGLVAEAKLEPAQIANGAVELLDEVSRSKITGEEERYSHTDLEDFEANVDGAQAAFAAVRELVVKRQPALAGRIDARFRAVSDALEPYKRNGTFVSYTTLARRDTMALSRVVDALAEPLSQVGALVVKG